MQTGRTFEVFSLVPQADNFDGPVFSQRFLSNVNKTISFVKTGRNSGFRPLKEEQITCFFGFPGC